MEIDPSAAFAAYEKRFLRAVGEKPAGAYAKFGRHMVQRLGRAEFEKRLKHYLATARALLGTLTQGGTVSDVLVSEVDESAAWIAIHAPDPLDPNVGAADPVSLVLKTSPK